MIRAFQRQQEQKENRLPLGVPGMLRQLQQRVYEMKCKEKVLEKGHIVTFCRIFCCFSKGSMMKSEAAL